MKGPQCQECKKQASKYTCPADNFLYCSLPCFKLHKASTCRSEAMVSSSTTKETAELLPPTDPAPALSASSLTETSDHRPTKRLKSLHWPPEPSSIFWDDPLRRDDVKPLRGFELEAISTNLALRPLLSSPAFQSIATSLLSIHSRRDRERSLRVLLGLEPDPVSAVYRPGEPPSVNSRGRGRGRGRGGRGGRGGGGSRGNEEERLVLSTEEERKSFGKVVKEVLDTLETARKEKGEKGRWDDNGV
ncbi:hypothetical protein T439DRAFT_381741 [Meredithblackwellia eburnea MCA 4105]